MVTTEEGNNRKCPPASCRDKGRGGVDEGALCLSWLGCDLGALRNPKGSRCHQDKHKAPTLPHIRPLSLQDPFRSSPFIGIGADTLPVLVVNIYYRRWPR